MDPRMKGRSFFCFRDSRFLNMVPKDRRREARHQFQEFPTQEEAQQLGYRQAHRETAIRRLKLRRLKHKIRAVREQGYPVFENYAARWNPEADDRPTRFRGRLVELVEFGNWVRDQLWEAIKAEHALPEEPPAATLGDDLAQEADEHERFMESHLRVYVGRQDLHDALVAFADGDAPFPGLVTGPSGSGKSAALSRFVTEYRRIHPDVLVISHFIGASPRSAGLRDLLRRLCHRPADRFGFGDEVPQEIDQLVDTFRDFLARVPADQRVLLVLDALNQLEETDRARELWWLPRELPPHVKVVASCIVDPKSKDAEEDPVARAFRQRPYRPVSVGPLSVREALTIVRRVPSLSAKTLDRDQRRSLLENSAAANPLYLRVALEELRGFGSFEQLNDRIAALPRDGLADAVLARAGFSPAAMRQAGDPLTALFVQVLERLKRDFDPRWCTTS